MSSGPLGSGGRARAAPFHRAGHTRARGAAAEDVAAAWLARRAYRILERNYRVRAGEVDVVALDGETLCFVEVKARAGRRFGSGRAAVTRAKRRRIARVAAAYLVASDWRGPCRFDVLALEARADGSWRFDLVRDAFRLDG